jgi:hypothetical protein
LNCLFLLKYFLHKKATIILKIKENNIIKLSMTINNLKVFDKLGSFNNPKFKEINNIKQKAIMIIDKHIPNIAELSFELLVI